MGSRFFPSDTPILFTNVFIVPVGPQPERLSAGQEAGSEDGITQPRIPEIMGWFVGELTLTNMFRAQNRGQPDM
jgi:hypothetical protein